MTRRRRLIIVLAALLIGLPLLAAALLWGLDRAFPPDLVRLRAVGTEVLDHDGRLLAALPAPGGVWRFHTTTDDISGAFLDLLIHTEDKRFWQHPGVDPVAAVRAAAQWVRAGHVVSGGSTLAMQAARLLHPRPRTLRSKLIESARALQLEWRYGRRGVLDIWLTLAPYGGNLEGVRAGARAWFGTSAAALDPAQAALMVAMPRRPEALRPDRYPDRARHLRDRVLAEAEGAPIPHQRQPFPRHAAQIVTRLGHDPVIHTTLDLPLQTALERLAADRLSAMPVHQSLALLVIDADTRAIRAAVSGDGHLDRRGGALDLTRAVRSPGSALKPFLYALAFEEGVARPDTPLMDLPQHFGSYAPENFARGHAGPIAAADALRQSLNLPAVALLNQVGPLRFAEALRAGGARPRLPNGADPSLPLALGGVGVTMRELAGLYAGLASKTGAGPLTLDPGVTRTATPQTEGDRLVAAILTRPFPAGGPLGVGWKTGTSWGGRDAWALGFDRRHVVAAWVGRPDGTPVPGATGQGLALPLVSAVFRLLPSAPRPLPPPVHMAAVSPGGAAAAGGTLRLLFPPPDAVLSGGSAVTLRAMGGRRPLTFLVDGAPLAASPQRREAGWHPEGPGFYTITVLDADGLAARAPVRVR